MSTANTFKTFILLTALTGILILIGRFLAGPSGMTIAIILAVVMNVGSYWFSDKIALSMAHAQEVSPEEAPDLHRVVEQLAAEAHIPKPRLYVVPTDSPNAFATGRNPSHAALAVTSGLLNMLGPDELRGVLSHEMGHMTVAATVAGAITFIAQMAQWAMFFGGFGGRGDDDRDSGMGGIVVGILMMILAPIAATVIQLAISRAREFEADATGARISGSPLALANALEKIESTVAYRPMQVPQAAAHLFIINPLGEGGWSNLFRTHPTTAERVARLRAMTL